MAEKICPILVVAAFSSPSNPVQTGCLEDECALWNQHMGCCGLISRANTPSPEAVIGKLFGYIYTGGDK